MKLGFLIGIIAFPVLTVVLLLQGCSININTQRPKIDTVYVEKYWGSDVPIPKQGYDIVYPIYRIDTLKYNWKVERSK